ncbi:MAG TPA: ABC transporter permease [Thermomicrobiales bacterium]|jgi:NitT/TauT family transport system permease protein
MASELRDTVPAFGKTATQDQQADVSLSNWSALTQMSFAKSGAEALALVLVAVLVIGGAEVAVRAFDIKAYIFPRPSAIGETLFRHFGLFWPHLKVTVRELLVGFAIGASIGIFLAAVITQFPFVEKVITPYILLLVTTPMIALVPLLMLRFGFGSTPRYIAVALASGPMVMINSATGFRRTDLAKIALARSYGASTFQIFTKVRFPLALPMIIVGLMVGSIFGLLTAVGAEMVGGKNGLGNQLSVYASLLKMSHFYAIILLLALMGVAIYVIFYLIGKRWASWQA